jgi:hypothetical protein
MNSSLASKRVLVVEDELLVSMLIEDVLVGAGCRVVGPLREITAPKWRNYTDRRHDLDCRRILLDADAVQLCRPLSCGISTGGGRVVFA